MYLKARLDPAQEGITAPSDGAGLFTYDTASKLLSWTVTYRNLTSAIIGAHLHGPAAPGVDAGIEVPMSPTASPITGSATITLAEEADLLAGLWYVNVHSLNFPNGEIRGQLTVFTDNSYILKSGTSAAPTSAFIDGSVTLDPASLLMTWNVSWHEHTGQSVLLGSTGFHGLDVPPAVGAIASGAPGSMPLTGVQAAALINGYWNFFVAETPSGFGAALVPNGPRVGNISTRMPVLTGGNVMIAGFIVGGAASKTVAITATGPSLAPFGIANFLPNPTIQLVRQSDGTTIATNDDWQTDANASLLQASGFAPGDALEPGLYVNLPPGAYTAIVSGVGGTTGVSVVGVFEVDHPESPLVNISTRGFVQTGGNVMIGGFIVQGTGPQKIAVTATGPSLAPFGIANFLANPTLTVVRSSDQSVVATNDDWQTDPNHLALQASGFAPGNPLEPGLLLTLQPGAYTAIVSGVGGTTGVSVIGAFTVP